MNRLIVLLALSLLLPLLAFSEVLYTLDFTGQSDGDAKQWLKDQDFKFELDVDDLGLFFKNGRLMIVNEESSNGLILKEVDIKKAKRIRIEWGVNQFPSGINWDQGVTRDVVMVVVSFGTEKISSGKFYIPDLPYFFGIFPSNTGAQEKAYTGSYYKKGGRYFCSPCDAKEGEAIVTEFELFDRFNSEFKQDSFPGISAIAIESDTRDLKERSEAYIKKIEILSE